MNSAYLITKSFGYFTSINPPNYWKNPDSVKGGITQTVVDIRLALKRTFEVGATTLIIVHNHPSGNLKPSEHYKELTRKFKKAASYVDLKVLDHLIVSEKGYFSFADEEII